MLELKYGKSELKLQFPESYSLTRLSYKQSSEPLSPDESRHRVKSALASPIGSKPLDQLAKMHSRAVIIIPDGSRLCPSPLLLPAILNQLEAAGIADNAIDIVVALGVHRKHTEEELISLVSEPIFKRIRVHNHSCLPEDCVHIGTTSSGTPVEINRLVAESGLRIAIGNIEPHSLVGVSGGVKSLVPGVASQRCIEQNHSLSLKYKATPGSPDNPVHRDLEEAHSLLPIHFLLNVVVDHERQVLGAFAGGVREAHKEGAALCAKHFLRAVDRQYDLIITSPGGHPKDLQLYQAIKTLHNAAAFVKPGGSIILAAECPEMLGNGMFQYWIDTMTDRERMTAKLQEHFILGAHKVLQLDQVLKRCKVYLYSSIPRPIVSLLGMEPIEALDELIRELLADSTVEAACMPFGALTFPVQPAMEP